MVTYRQGTFGYYYGNEVTSSNPLTEAQMQANAIYIYSYLSPLGWTVNAVAALLGNMQAESSINPGRWQNDRVGGNPERHGYGLVQWTPYTKYTDWVRDTFGSSADPSTMDHNLARIDYEVQMGIQWGPTSSYPMSFKDFTTSTEHPGELAKAFLLNYERPEDQSESVQNYRNVLAQIWYTYLTGVTPNPPSPVGTPKKKGFNFILFGGSKTRRIF